MSLLTWSWYLPQKEHFRPFCSSNLNMPSPRLFRGLGTRDEDIVYQAVSLGFFSAHPEIPLSISLYLIERLTRMLCQDLVKVLLGAQDLLGCYLYFCRLSLNTAKRLVDFKGYQVNDELLAHAPDHVKIMHCLPAHRGEEITDSVLESPRSIVFDQAENRLHGQKAIMKYLVEHSQK